MNPFIFESSYFQTNSTYECRSINRPARGLQAVHVSIAYVKAVNINPTWRGFHVFVTLQNPSMHIQIRSVKLELDEPRWGQAVCKITVCFF